jgi:hypothetical protein
VLVDDNDLTIRKIEALVAEFERDPADAWLASSVELRDASGDVSHDALLRLHDALGSVSDRAAALRGDVSALSETIAQLADHVRTRRRAEQPAGTPWWSPTRDWLESTVTAELQDEILRSELFGGSADVRLDLADWSLHWIEAGERLDRPLEAFSSGERAFTYTRAVLMRFMREPTRRRIAVLDEFGAYLARDRLAPLVDDLNAHVGSGDLHEAIVVLPLQSDYEALAEDSAGPLKEVAERRRDAIRDRGYFVEAFQRLT